MQITDNEEIYYSMALTRLSGVNHAVALQLYKELGDAQAVYGPPRRAYHGRTLLA